MTEQQDKAGRNKQREGYISTIAGYITGKMNDSRFEQALEIAKEFNLPEDGIKFAKNYVGAKFALAAILTGGFKDGWSGASNAAFSSAVGALAGPGYGAFYGTLLDYISAETREHQVGESLYDILHSKEVSGFIGRNSDLLAQGAAAIMDSIQGAPDAPRPLNDASGKLQGYFVITRDPKTQAVTATTLTPDGDVARQRVFDGNTLTTSGNGISVVKNYRTGETSATTPWDASPVPVEADGSINANGCQIKLAADPLGGATITCDGETFNASPSADFKRQGDLLVVRDAGGGTIPSLVIGPDGNSYALGYNGKAGGLYATPFGGTAAASTADVLSWMRRHGGQSILEGLSGAGSSATPSPGAASEPAGPRSAAPDRPWRDRFNFDGSGSTTSTNPDGTTSTSDFDNVTGAVKLADIFGTLPEVVAAHPDRFALRYMSMANQQRAQPQNQPPGAGDQAVDSSVPAADAVSDTSSGTSSDAQPSGGADAAHMSDQHGPETTGAPADSGSAATQEQQDAGGEAPDEAVTEEAVA